MLKSKREIVVKNFPRFWWPHKSKKQMDYMQEKKVTAGEGRQGNTAKKHERNTFNWVTFSGEKVGAGNIDFFVFFTSDPKVVIKAMVPEELFRMLWKRPGNIDDCSRDVILPLWLLSINPIKKY